MCVYHRGLPSTLIDQEGKEGKMEYRVVGIEQIKTLDIKNGQIIVIKTDLERISDDDIRELTARIKDYAPQDVLIMLLAKGADLYHLDNFDEEKMRDLGWYRILS